MRTFRGGESVGEIAGHIMVNSLQDNLLADYDPYATPNSAGDVGGAGEIAQSAYDTDGDGVCDAPECSNILAATDEADPYPDQAALIQQNMEPLGLTFDVKSFERTTMYAKCNEPEAHVAVCLAPAGARTSRTATRSPTRCSDRPRSSRAAATTSSWGRPDSVEGRLRDHRGPVGRRPDPAANRQTGTPGSRHGPTSTPR